ncbi:MAG: lysine--tRNA ligase [Fimbriimonadaceae bacterium]
MSEETIREYRIEKLQGLRSLGKDPFLPERFDRERSASELLENFAEGQKVSFAGRIVSLRVMGKAAFTHLSDGDGKIQVYLRKDDLAEAEWGAVTLLDLGDHLGVTGELFVTKTGEQSIHARSLTPLSKALVAPPIGKEKDGQVFYGLTDIDQRYRHRHLDLIANPEARKTLLDRSRIVSAVRRYFDREGYFEVETPILQLEAGGAHARPFHTHYNAYGIDVKLRISLELYLKRIICGDVPRVYEIGRVFRNEGVSNRHNPEFTMLEFYEAYTDLEGMMSRVEGLIRFVTQEVFGTCNVGGCDFAQPWARVDLLTEIEVQCGVRPDELRDLDSARTAMSRLGLPVEKEHNLGGIIEKLLERFVEPTLQQPTFVIGYPIETSPLAKRDPNRPGITRRFEGYAFGRELCNAFSELNDPIDQRDRFEQQVGERGKGDDEAHPMDEEFIFALESGMPPTGGCGIGIDRLVMLLTGSEHLREILLFPMMKPAPRATSEADGGQSAATRIVAE